MSKRLNVLFLPPRNLHTSSPGAKMLSPRSAIATI